MAKKNDKTTKKPAPKKTAANKEAPTKKSSQKRAPARKQVSFEDGVSVNREQKIVQTKPSPKPQDKESDSKDNE